MKCKQKHCYYRLGLLGYGLSDDEVVRCSMQLRLNHTADQSVQDLSSSVDRTVCDISDISTSLTVTWPGQIGPDCIVLKYDEII